MDTGRPNRRLYALALIPVVLGLAVWGAVEGWRAVSARRATEAALNASKTQSILDRSLEGATGLRVWGAGMRIGDDKFCDCVIVPTPPRVFYESTDPREVKELLATIRPRPYRSLNLPATCGMVTIDFLRADQRIFTINILGEHLLSSRGILPITSESAAGIEEWLTRHSIRERMAAALTSSTKK